ncbi:restriction endonuclease subunit S [Dysgonomonas sp.]
MVKVKQGYKQTDIGVIPEDWEILTLESFSEIYGRIGFRGYTINDIVEKEDGAIAISPSNIKHNKICFENSTYISWFKYEESPEIKIYNGDILLVKTGSTFGKTALVKGLHEKATINPQLVVFKNIKVNNTLLSYIMSDNVIQRQIASTIVGGAIPTLSQKQVQSFRLALPPTNKEQEAIATALSDIDSLIDELTKLIEKKRAIKEGVMQQLLSPKESWEEKYLGGYILFQVGFPFESINFNTKEDGLRLIKNRDLKSDDTTTFYNGKYTNDFLVYNGDVLIGMDGDFILCLWKKGKALLNQRVGRLIIKKGGNISLEFLYYYLTPKLKEIEKITSSTTVKHLSHNDIEDLSLLLPQLKEQQQIALTLSDMDSEIESLEQNLLKYKVVKKGMMQQLLTGQIRLI